MTTIDSLQSERTFRTLILVLLLVLGANGSAFAIDPVRMGFVDMTRIMADTGMAKNSEAEARQVVSEARARLESEQQAIVKMQQDYKRDEAIMSESQRSAKQEAMQSRLQAYQQMAVDLQQEINKKKLQHAEKVLRPVQKIIQDIAREEGLNAVFERSDSGLLFVDDSLDLTDRAIERLRAEGK